jgi:16S rRNA (adenine1518-N6/adenine1519-N6)-dimethyltransferase
MTSPKTLLKAHNIRAKKSLGQNFLLDSNMARKIVSHARIQQNATVVEIGAGLGALTIPLARTARKVYAIEKDRLLLQMLNTELLVSKISNVVPIAQDVLKLDLRSLAGGDGEKLIVVGNLPYNISSQVLIRLIEQRSVVERAVLMFQKELAERLKAGTGTKSYGRITVMLRYCAVVKSLKTVEADLFFPKPKVESKVLELTFFDRHHLLPQEEAFLFKVIKIGFGMRRKTLKNALAGGPWSLTPSMAVEAMRQAGIDPQRRAETLEVNEFIALSRALSALLNLSNQG